MWVHGDMFAVTGLWRLSRVLVSFCRGGYITWPCGAGVRLGHWLHLRQHDSR